MLKWAATGLLRRMHLSHILLLTSAFNKVDDITRPAGGCSSYVEGLAGCGTHERLSSTDVMTREAASIVAWTAPLVDLTISYLELGTSQKVP